MNHDVPDKKVRKATLLQIRSVVTESIGWQMVLWVPVFFNRLKDLRELSLLVYDQVLEVVVDTSLSILCEP